nr:MAG TPA: hypothetical protein [Caudoviricetes sp.]
MFLISDLTLFVILQNLLFVLILFISLIVD